MNAPVHAIAAPRIFDGERWHEGSALVVERGRVAEIVRLADLPAGVPLSNRESGFLAPGFVDLQVNGGGGVMLNDRPDVAAIETIIAAHRRFGTTALLPTLITDTPEVTKAAIAAGINAVKRGVPGFLGLHLEGPHLSVARKGAHDPALIRPMEEEDLLLLCETAGALPVLYSTVAVESVTPEQIGRLRDAGVWVSLGHTDTGFAGASAAFAAGASLATHLFNAMSQLGNREPGVVGAVLDTDPVHAGLIADGIHVAPAAIRAALRAKQGPGRIFLVTDAMATIGTDMQSFTLNGRTIHRADGRLTLDDGTLAGADLDMAAAVRFTHRTVGVNLEEALRMASLYPAEAVGVAPEHGRLLPGSRADAVALDEALEVETVWIGGVEAQRG